VFAPTTPLPPGSLAGAFSGAVGVSGVNMLVSGSGNTISLQPLNIEGSTRLALNLTYQGCVTEEPPQPSLKTE
jgi:hypothetical protein